MTAAMAQPFDQFSTLDDLGDFAPILRARPDILVLVKLFRGLPSEDVDIIAHYMRAYVALEDTVVFREGDIGDAMLFIVEGMVHVYRGDPLDGVTLGILRSRQNVWRNGADRKHATLRDLFGFTRFDVRRLNPR